MDVVRKASAPAEQEETTSAPAPAPLKRNDVFAQYIKENRKKFLKLAKECQQQKKWKDMEMKARTKMEMMEKNWVKWRWSAQVLRTIARERWKNVPQLERDAVEQRALTGAPVEDTGVLEEASAEDSGILCGTPTKDGCKDEAEHVTTPSSSSSIKLEAAQASRTRSQKACHEQKKRFRLPAGRVDAPKSHRIWQRKLYCATTGLCRFQYEGENFQTTLKAAGSQAECERIARLCFLRFEWGWKKADVECFRDKMYEKTGQVGKLTNLGTWEWQGRPEKRKLPQDRSCSTRRRTLKASHSI
jgi:hypothetical protein